jgi:hypothetical protein
MLYVLTVSYIPRFQITRISASYWNYLLPAVKTLGFFLMWTASDLRLKIIENTLLRVKSFDF